MKYHFPFYLQGQQDAPNQSGSSESTLDLFHLNMTAIIWWKIKKCLAIVRQRQGEEVI